MVCLICCYQSKEGVLDESEGEREKDEMNVEEGSEAHSWVSG
jgi:hypothetical protein